MASEWPEIALEELADELTVGFVGPMATEYVHEGIPFLRSQNVESLRIRTEDIKYISPAFHQRIRKSSLRPGDVVIVRTGKPGACAVIPTALSVANCSDLVIVRCGERLLPEFLAYFVNSAATHHISSHLVGAVQQHFNVGAARRILIPLPTISEQRTIVHILGTLDEKIELNRRMNETLEAMARALFQSWFVDFDPVRAKAAVRREHPRWTDAEVCRAALPTLAPEIAALFPDSFENSPLGDIPIGWQIGKFSDVAENSRRGISPGDIPELTPYIALEHMPRKCIALSEWGIADGVESGKFAFNANDILFGKLRPYFHKVGVAPIDGVCSTDILVLSPRAPEWFGFVLSHASSDAFVEHANAGSTGTKMPRTNWADMAKYPVILPPETLAKAYTAKTTPAISRIIASIHQNHSLAALRDTLLPKLISGELPVKDTRGCY